MVANLVGRNAFILVGTKCQKSYKYGNANKMDMSIELGFNKIRMNL